MNKTFKVLEYLELIFKSESDRHKQTNKKNSKSGKCFKKIK